MLLPLLMMTYTEHHQELPASLQSSSTKSQGAVYQPREQRGRREERTAAEVRSDKSQFKIGESSTMAEVTATALLDTISFADSMLPYLLLWYANCMAMLVTCMCACMCC